MKLATVNSTKTLPDAWPWAKSRSTAYTIPLEYPYAGPNRHERRKIAKLARQKRVRKAV